MAKIYILYLEDSSVSQGLRIIRRLCDLGSGSKPHVTVYGPVRSRRKLPEFDSYQFDSITFKKLDSWETPTHKTAFIKCHLGDKSYLHYKPDFPCSVPHITLFHGKRSHEVDELLSLLPRLKLNAQIFFQEPRTIIARDLGKKGRSNLRIPNINDEELYFSLFGSHLTEINENMELELRKSRLLGVIEHLSSLFSKCPQDPSESQEVHKQEHSNFINQLEFDIHYNHTHHEGSYDSHSETGKKLGQFLTPPEVALDIIKCTMPLVHFDEIDFGDPAVGTGIFYGISLDWARTDNKREIKSAIGIDADPSICELCNGQWGSRGLEVINADATRFDLPAQRNLIVCNPPYVSHKLISSDKREEIHRKISDIFGLDLRLTTNLNVYFVFICYHWLRDGGVCSILLSSDFNYSEYSRELRGFLLQNCTIHRVHNYDPSQRIFDNVDTSSSVIIFQKSPPKENHKVSLTFGTSLKHAESKKLISNQDYIAFERWPLRPPNAKAKHTAKSRTKLGELFDVKRGIATGANNFFILSQEKAKELNIPEEFIVKILKKPSKVTSEIINGRNSKKHIEFLIDCDKTIDYIRLKYPDFYRYLELGISEGIHERTLPKSRTPWYSQESRDFCPFVFPAIGRINKNKSSFRFILINDRKKDILVNNNYYMLQPMGKLEKMIRNKEITLKEVHKHLRSIESEQIESKSRVFGGGLLKNEPTDLKSLIIPNWEL